MTAWHARWLSRRDDVATGLVRTRVPKKKLRRLWLERMAAYELWLTQRMETTTPPTMPDFVFNTARTTAFAVGLTVDVRCTVTIDTCT
jgi:hypothetical protein